MPAHLAHRPLHRAGTWPTARSASLNFLRGHASLWDQCCSRRLSPACGRQNPRQAMGAAYIRLSLRFPKEEKGENAAEAGPNALKQRRKPKPANGTGRSKGSSTSLPWFTGSTWNSQVSRKTGLLHRLAGEAWPGLGSQVKELLS